MNKNSKDLLSNLVSNLGCGIPFLTVIILVLSIWLLERQFYAIFAYLTGMNTLLLYVTLLISLSGDLWYLRMPEIMVGNTYAEEYRYPFLIVIGALYISIIAGLVSIILALYEPTLKFVYIPSVTQVICFLVTISGLFGAFAKTYNDYDIDKR